MGGLSSRIPALQTETVTLLRRQKHHKSLTLVFVDGTFIVRLLVRSSFLSCMTVFLLLTMLYEGGTDIAKSKKVSQKWQYSNVNFYGMWESLCIELCVGNSEARY